MRLQQVDWQEVGKSNLSSLVTKEVLWKATELEMGQEMLPIRLEELEKKILAVSWVESVQIQKRLPSTLVVRYTTHNARATALRKGKLWTISSTGEWIAPLGKLHLDLPVIMTAQEPQAAIKWLDVLESDLRPYVAQVHEVKGNAGSATRFSALIDLKYPSKPAKVTLLAGDEPSPENLDRLKRVVQYLIKNNILVSTIDLRPGKKVVVNVGQRP